MQQRILGRTGQPISELALGGLFVSRVGGDREEAIRAIHRALELGVNWIDTAPGYHDSEEVIGAALRSAPREALLSTKLGGRPLPFDPRDRHALRASFEESLRLLGRDHVDLLLIHEPERPGQYDWWTDWENLDGPVLEVLEELKAQGKIRWTGVGGTTAYEMARFLATGRFDVVLTAFNYSLLWREAEIAVLPEAA
ncbi:MAG: aldo/keto reductase, partial [SAR202 cluster bacterium]|nr:aldo/keto reductase [SAR202 cluster bacterium]